MFTTKACTTIKIQIIVIEGKYLMINKYCSYEPKACSNWRTQLTAVSLQQGLQHGSATWVGNRRPTGHCWPASNNIWPRKFALF